MVKAFTTHSLITVIRKCLLAFTFNLFSLHTYPFCNDKAAEMAGNALYCYSVYCQDQKTKDFYAVPDWQLLKSK